MKRGSGLCVPGTAFAALCLFLSLTTARLQGSEPAARVAHVFYIHNQNWASSLVGVSKLDGSTLHLADYSACPGPTLTMPARTQVLRPDMTGDYCKPAPIAGVADLTTTGDVELLTEATFTDAQKNFNRVAIPELRTFIAKDSNAKLNFERLENGAGRSTFFAVVTSAPTYVTLAAFDKDNHAIGIAQSFAVDGFAFVQLAQEFVDTNADGSKRPSLGRVELQRGTVGFGCQGCNAPADVYAIALVGQLENGGPRVELPTLLSN